MHVESWSASVCVCVSSSLFYVAPRVLFVVSFAVKPRTNLAMNFVRPLSAKVRDLTAARQLVQTALLKPLRARNSDAFKCAVDESEPSQREPPNLVAISSMTLEF
jgi:hypothetical protein